jgi:hypothetical protein
LILLNNIYQILFFKPKVGQMEIDKTPTQIRAQNLCIVRWIVMEGLTKVNLGSEKNPQ